MDGVARALNADALAQALLWTMIVPWIPCLGFYTLMHWTYKKDKDEYRAQLSSLMDQQEQCTEASQSRDIAMTVRGRGGAVSCQEEEERAGLLNRDSA